MHDFRVKFNILNAAISTANHQLIPDTCHIYITPLILVTRT